MDRKKIGKVISNQRRTLSMTQQELALKLNVTNKAVSKWETGEGYPDISTLPALAEVLGVTVDDLLKGKINSNEHVLNKESSNHNVDLTEQTSYLFNKCINQFTNSFLISLSIVVAGIVMSILGLKLYNGYFTPTLIYPFVIAILFLTVSIIYYKIIVKNLKNELAYYNILVDEKNTVDYKKVVKNKHIIFTSIYMLLVNFVLVFIPLYPFRSLGYYKVNGRLFGLSTFPDWQPSILSNAYMFVDYGFSIAAFIGIYIISTILVVWVIKSKRKGKKN